MVDSLHPPLNCIWEMSSQGSFVCRCRYGVQRLPLCRGEVLVLEEMPCRGVAVGMKRRETPSELFSFILQMNQMAGAAETKGGA